MTQYLVIKGSFALYCYCQDKPEGKETFVASQARLLDLLLESSKESR